VLDDPEFDNKDPRVYESRGFQGVTQCTIRAFSWAAQRQPETSANRLRTTLQAP